MTPSQKAKAEGLKSLSQVSNMTGVSVQTLGNWHRNKPELFEVVLSGCASMIGADVKTKRIRAALYLMNVDFDSGLERLKKEFL